MLPALPGFIAFGTITGATVVNADFTSVEAIAMNVIVFDGTAELPIAGLVGQNATVAVIVLTGLLIVLRFAMLSAAIAPYLRRFPTRWQWAAGLFLNTAAYVLSVAKFEADEPVDRRGYYFGAAVPMWATWQVSFVVGVVVGTLIPSSWQLTFTFPLVFIALIFPTLEDRPTVAAALVAGPTALVAAGLPANMGLLVAILLGVAVGFLVQRWGN